MKRFAWKCFKFVLCLVFVALVEFMAITLMALIDAKNIVNTIIVLCLLGLAAGGFFLSEFDNDN